MTETPPKICITASVNQREREMRRDLSLWEGASKAPRGVITGVWKYQHKLMGNIYSLHIVMVTII